MDAGMSYWMFLLFASRADSPSLAAARCPSALSLGLTPFLAQLRLVELFTE